MLTAVVDTNVLVAGTLTGRRSASRRLIDRQHAREFVLALSPEALQEIYVVLRHPRLRAMHGQSDSQIQEFCRRLEIGARMFPGSIPVSAALTRDVTDTKWIALALEARADYLVTLDRRHLARLKRVGQTKILTPHKFLLRLDQHV